VERGKERQKKDEKLTKEKEKGGNNKNNF